MKKFLIDSLFGVAVSAAVIGGFALVISGLPLAWVIILGFSPLLGFIAFTAILGGPIAAIFTGAGRSRPGMIFGPLLLLAFLFLGLQGYLWFEYFRLSALEMRQFMSPSKPHDTVFMVTFEGDDVCDGACLQLLSQKSYIVAVGSLEKPSSGFYLGRGSACVRADVLSSLIAFSRMGYAKQCALKKPMTEIREALIVMRSVDFRVPDIFQGQFYQLVERTEGKDRVLGRWISGYIGYINTLRIGKDFQPYDFYSQALGASISHDLRQVGKDSPLDIVSGLDPVIESGFDSGVSEEQVAGFLTEYELQLDRLYQDIPAEAVKRARRMQQSLQPQIRAIGFSMSSKYGKNCAAPTQSCDP